MSTCGEHVKHPAEVFLKYLLLREEDLPDANILKNLQDWDVLPPTITDLNFIRQQVSERPNRFDPFDRIHRPSMAFLRQHGVYELFIRLKGVNEAWDILADPTMRLNVERLLARLDRKQTAHRSLMPSTAGSSPTLESQPTTTSSGA